MFTCPGCGVEATTDARHRDGCPHETALYLKSAAGKADEIGRAARDLADAAPETPDSGAPEPEQARSAHDLNVRETLRKLPEVCWDRFVTDPDHPNHWVYVYGWLPRRPDGYFDFVTVTFVDGKPRGFSTSSAAHSEELNERLFPGSRHYACVRVNERWPDAELLGGVASVSASPTDGEETT